MIPLWALTLPLDSINTVCKTVDLDWKLLAAIVYQESKGDQNTSKYEPNAEKYTTQVFAFAHGLGISQITEKVFQMTSHGYCQLMGFKLREMGFHGTQGEAYDKMLNLTYGAKFLKKLTGKYTDIRLAIASYNSGSPIYDLNGELINRTYVDDVQKYMSQL